MTDTQEPTRATRATKQRAAITDLLDTVDEFRSAQELHDELRRRGENIGLTTVYRTLQLLKRQGLIDELDLMHIHGEGHYYERKLNRDHIHMACLRCGKIMEFVSDVFDKLKRQVEKDCSFQILVSRLEIGGYCNSCRGAQ